MQFIEIIAPSQSEVGEVILKHFAKHKQPIEKTEVIRLIKNHLIYLENKPVGFLPFKIFKKAKIQIYLDSVKGWEISDSQILFEDKWLIAIDKPSGLPSQSSLKFLQDHAYSAVKCYLRNKKPFTSPQLFLLHRLDMDTSGVLILSKKSSINKGMQSLFEKREIQKTYRAISQSKESKSCPKVIKSYLTRTPDKIHKFKFGSTEDKSDKKAKYAETHIRLLKNHGDLYEFEVKPKTGRSHQIRVHLKEAGFPILGDVFYNGEKAPQLHLHALSLDFKHPMTQDSLRITSPTPKSWTKL